MSKLSDAMPSNSHCSLRHALRASWRSSPAPERQIALGIIGVGNRGAANLAAVGHEHVVALCDVDGLLEGAANQYQDAATFRDYREMLDADLDLDAVVVSTPDHTHAPASMAAMQRGCTATAKSRSPTAWKKPRPWRHWAKIW